MDQQQTDEPRPRDAERPQESGAASLGRGGRKAGPTPGNAVSCNIDRSDRSGQSFFGKVSHDTGHSRVPEPPDKITGTMC
jgi:hypothetical protein